MCLFICRELEVILLGFSHVPPTLPSTALLPREKLQVRHSLEQRAVHLSWLSRSGRKELDFVLLGREWLPQIREVPLTRKKKSRKRFQSLSVGLVYCHTRALASCHSAILWVEDCVPGKPESMIVNHYCV